MYHPSPMVSEGRSWRRSARQFAAWAILFALALGSVEWRTLRFLAPDLRPFEHHYQTLPDRGVEDYVRFLDSVRERTRKGDAIGILAPTWTGYEYAYYRASYILAGRRVIPLVDPTHTLRPDRIDEADWIAGWQMGMEVKAFREEWKGAGGVLLRRVR